MPIKSSYSDLNEYLARFAVFSVPRVCSTYVAYDGDHNDPKHQKKTQGIFQIRSISRNGHADYDHWYSVRAAINQVDGKFYFNSNNPQELTCGYLNFEKSFLKTGKVKWADQKIILSAEQINQLINLDASKPSSATTPKQQSVNSSKRPIAVRWEGYKDLFAGHVILNQGTGQGSVKATLPNNDGTCDGTYKLSSRELGTWNITCTNGMSASGTMKDFGAGKGSAGQGVDSKGNKVNFTLGGA